jgi:hypothetical protein
MQKDNDSGNRRIITSVEVVNVPPPFVTDNEATLKSDNVYDGTTKLTTDYLHHLFQGRNLAFVATLSKDGSPHVTPVWAEMVDDLILINTFATSAKNRIYRPITMYCRRSQVGSVNEHLSDTITCKPYAG